MEISSYLCCAYMEASVVALHAALSCLQVCISADAIEVSVAHCKPFMPMSSPLSLPPHPPTTLFNNSSYQRKSRYLYAPAPHLASPHIFSTPQTFDEKLFTEAQQGTEVQGRISLLKCIPILPAPHGKQKVQ